MASVKKTLKVTNMYGLHARPAALVVETCSRYDSEVTLIKDGLRANGKSIMSVMLLAAEAESEIELEAEGTQAEEAALALEALFIANFNEDQSSFGD